MAADNIKMVSLSSLTINKSLDEAKYAQLTWSIRSGYPRLVVFTDKSKVRDNKEFDYNSMIIAPFDYTTMETLFNIADEIISGEKGINKQIACYNTKFVDGARTNEVVLQATVEVGQDDNGVIYMGVLSDGKKKVRFDIKPKDDGKWHKYYIKGDLVTDQGVISRIYAKAYFAQARRLMGHYMVADTVKSKAIERKAPTLNEAPSKSIDTSSVSDDDLF